MFRSIAILTVISAAQTPVDPGDMGALVLSLMVALVLANLVNKLIDRRWGNGDQTAVLQKIEAGLSADTAIIAALVGRMETAERMAAQRHDELIRAINALRAA